jgi:predicted DNA-binding transcriptional regulator YafY
MRRADRLFRIVQRLRRRGATTAAQLAEALEVSERTIYRDIQDLMVSGVPIRGEAGVGYALPRDFDLPPLMFDAEEIEALVLGCRIVKSWSDPDLAKAADSVLNKVESVLPERLRDRIAESALFAVNFRQANATGDVLIRIRQAIRAQRKTTFDYVDEKQSATRRTVRPLGLFYWGQKWSLGAWCETRVDFRNFRLDRVSNLELLEATFVPEPGKTLNDYFVAMRSEDRRNLSEGSPPSAPRR